MSTTLDPYTPTTDAERAAYAQRVQDAAIARTVSGIGRVHEDPRGKIGRDGTREHVFTVKSADGARVVRGRDKAEAEDAHAAEWHRFIRSAPSFAVAQDRMGLAVAAGVDFAKLNAAATR